MMRSLFSGISGLKVHQTRMDVIGNNISNVNTVGFRASSVNFTDVFYQTTQGASGPNNETKAPGTNATQIGLGSNVAAIAVDLSGTGATQRTDRGMDVMINGDAFLIAEQNGMTYFTKSGALDVDANGTLYCTTNGAAILGWPAIEQADGSREIRKDSATQLQLMGGENAYSEPHATTDVTMKGNIDNTASQLDYKSPTSMEGYPLAVSFYDKLGNLNTAKFALQKAEVGGQVQDNMFTIKLTDVLGPDGKSLLREQDDLGDWYPMGTVVQTVDTATGKITRTAPNPVPTADQNPIKLDINGNAITYTVSKNGDIQTITSVANGWPKIKFNGSTGEFEYVCEDVLTKDPTTGKYSDPTSNQTQQTKGLLFGMIGLGESPYLTDTLNTTVTPNKMEGGVVVDFSNLTMYAQDGVCSVKPTRGTEDGSGTGNEAGSLNGFSVQTDGKIYGVYTNGDKNLLGQIAVATFANPSGLEAVGNSLFQATKNSGDFDGVGIDISEVGKFSVGALEMSDVDLANEFTTMITTQRGFQANSRIITTSDSMLEELVNLKR